MERLGARDSSLGSLIRGTPSMAARYEAIKQGSLRDDSYVVSAVMIESSLVNRNFWQRSARSFRATTWSFGLDA